MVYLILQEKDTDHSLILSLILSIRIADNTAMISVYCTPSIQSYVEGLHIKNQYIEFNTIKDTCSIDGYMINIIRALTECLGKYDEVIFLNNNNILINPINIDDEL